ncbi:MAG: DUF1570 domain-containing protein [Planctomycetes bacterium]|nr:DUF1570 domain-containing protein [Planctomycetota bacterium]
MIPIAKQTFRLLPLALAALIAAPANADRLVTRDGRVVEARKIRETPDGYEITFEHGVVHSPKELVASAEVIEDVSDYVPKNDDEKKKLEAGFVRFNGKWMSKGQMQVEFDKRAKELAKRTEERALHNDFFKGWTKETAHFKFRTNTSPELLDYYANLLETYYGLMDARIGIKPTPTLRSTKMQVNIYKSWDEFREINEANVGGGVAGYFSPPDKTLNFFHHYSDPGMSTWVALHECTHLLTFLIDPQFVPSYYSIWVNEGVADYFGSADVTVDPKSKKITIQPGKLQLSRTLTVQQAIKDGNDIKLADLLLIQRNQFTAFAYAHAWSFVYFLHSKDATRKAFTSFFKELYTRTNVDSEMLGDNAVVKPEIVRELLLSKLKLKDIDALDREWKAFVASIPVDGPEARFQRAKRYVDFFDGEEDQARKDLDAAIEGGVQHPDAFAGRAELALRRGDRDAAITDYKRAIAIDPLSASYRFALAEAVSKASFFVNTGPIQMTVSGASTKTRLDSDLTQAEVDEAEAQIGLAAALDPENAAYAKTLEKYKKAKERWLARKAKGAAAGANDKDDGASGE